MAICGWCKAKGLKLVKDTDTEEGTQDKDGGLQWHVVRGTHSAECRGYETYRNLGPDGRHDRNLKR